MPSSASSTWATLSVVTLGYLSLLAVGVAGDSLNNTLRSYMLDKHNEFRRLTGVTPTAGNMKKLKWDFELEEMAQRWADKCDFNHGQPDKCTGTLPSAGQNLYLTSASKIADVTGPVTSWYNEIGDYTYSTNGCKAGKACGHYTQVVWANTEKVGCAFKVCGSVAHSSISSGVIVVCNYGPPGNYVGAKPYTEGTACADCPADHVCENNLCAKSTANYYDIPAPAYTLGCPVDNDDDDDNGSVSPHLSMMAIVASSLIASIIVI